MTDHCGNVITVNGARDISIVYNIYFINKKCLNETPLFSKNTMAHKEMAIGDIIRTGVALFVTHAILIPNSG